MAIKMVEYMLPRAATPEELGISSRTIINFLDECIQKKIELHSFMLIRHGKVAAQGSWAPYATDKPHACFSVSKSITATAIGYAIDEGLLSLDTKVYSIFPEHSPVYPPRYANDLTVEHLLGMTSGKTSSFMINTEVANWVKYFLKAPFKFKPGTKFSYMSENSYILCAIIEKLTGEKVVDYLMPRFFSKLGIAKPFWETDSKGIETGGWGLYLKIEDMAKICECYLNNGKFNEEQVIPEFWAKSATAFHTANYGTYRDMSSGYGYGFWRCQEPNAFRCDGMFSQMAIAMPDHDCSFVCFGGEPEEGRMLETLWNHIPREFSSKALPENEKAFTELQKRLNALSLEKLPESERNYDLEDKINGRLMKFRHPFFNSMLGVPSNFIRSKRSGSLNNIMVDFKEDKLHVSWTEKYDRNTILAGLDGEWVLNEKVTFAGNWYTVAAQGCWMSDGSLSIWLRLLEQPQVRKIRIHFGENDHVKMSMWAEKGFYELLMFNYALVGIQTNKPLVRLTRVANTLANTFVDPNMKGKFYKKIY